MAVAEVDGRQSWDRRPGETSPAWAAFVVYRDMGGQRSTAKVQQERGYRVRRHVDKWSGEHDWVARAAAWDAHLDAANQVAQLDLRRILAEELLGEGGEHFRQVAQRHRELATRGAAQTISDAMAAIKAYYDRTVGPVPKRHIIATEDDVASLVRDLFVLAATEIQDPDAQARLAESWRQYVEGRGAGD